MVQVQKGAVKFVSIRAMAEAAAKVSDEPVNKVYMRLYMRMRMGQNASKAFHRKARKYKIN